MNEIVEEIETPRGKDVLAFRVDEFFVLLLMKKKINRTKGRRAKG